MKILCMSLFFAVCMVISYGLYLAGGAMTWALVLCAVSLTVAVIVDLVSHFNTDPESYEKPFWERRVTHRRSHWRPRPQCFFRMHTMEVIKDTGVLLYRECPHCFERTVTHYARSWHPVDTQWLLTGVFHKTSPRSIFRRQGPDSQQPQP